VGGCGVRGEVALGVGKTRARAGGWWLASSGLRREESVLSESTHSMGRASLPRATRILDESFGR